VTKFVAAVVEVTNRDLVSRTHIRRECDTRENHQDRKPKNSFHVKVSSVNLVNAGPVCALLTGSTAALSRGKS
jgi:hypothetical protein